MDEIQIRNIQTLKSGEIKYEKYELRIKAIGSRAAKLKARAWVRKNSIIEPAVPKISDPELVTENKRPLAGRNIYDVETAIWK